MLVIGLTGGIGSGKTRAANVFASLGVPVIDADVISREVVQPSGPILSQLVDAFGSHILQKDGTLNRQRLRNILFADPQARAKAEMLLHPAIRQEMLRRLEKITAPYAILVIPLLLESGQTDLVQRVLVVDCDEAVQRQRVTKRDGAPPEQIEAMMAAQVSRATRLAKADDVLDNNGTPEELDRQVRRLHGFYQTLAQQANPDQGPSGEPKPKR